jgi:choline monooxygenase
LEDHYNIELKGHYSGQGSYVYKQITGSNKEIFKDFINLSKKWKTGSEYISLFPNVLLGVHRDHTTATILEPISTNKTRERIEIHYASEESLSIKYAAMRQKNKSQWQEIFEEDVSVVEGMQKGRHGIFFDGGKFSPAMDSPTHIFHTWVAEKYINWKTNKE